MILRWKILHELRVTSPSSTSVSIKTAVCMVVKTAGDACALQRLAGTVFFANGHQAGISSSASFISLRPHSASVMSFTLVRQKFGSCYWHFISVLCYFLRNTKISYKFVFLNILQLFRIRQINKDILLGILELEAYSNEMGLQSKRDQEQAGVNYLLAKMLNNDSVKIVYTAERKPMLRDSPGTYQYHILTLSWRLFTTGGAIRALILNWCGEK